MVNLIINNNPFPIIKSHTYRRTIFLLRLNCDIAFIIEQKIVIRLKFGQPRFRKRTNNLNIHKTPSFYIRNKDYDLIMFVYRILHDFTKEFKWKIDTPTIILKNLNKKGLPIVTLQPSKPYSISLLFHPDET